MADHRVLIDGYYLGKPSGYGRFIGELCRALGNAPTNLEFFVAVQQSTDERFLKPHTNINYVRMSDITFPIWEQTKLPFCAFRNHCDVIHFPYNTRALATRKLRTVTTVHDLTFLMPHVDRDLKSSLIHFYMSTMFRMGTVKSDAIVAVSDTTKDALSQKGISSKRIYNTVDGFLETKFADSVKPSTGSRRYFLHRGSYAPGHRNTERIIKAFLSRPELVDNFALKILGTPDGASHWQTTPDQPIEYLAHVTDSELASLYAGSASVIAASLLEGFCLPIIEAFGFGAPVIASNINPMMEIAGDAALLVSPFDIDDLAQAMVAISSNGALAEDLIWKGKRRLLDFSSDKMAGEMIDLYTSLLRRDQQGGRRSPAAEAVSAR
jgi:glycosyltransferase involved in cell wall biosynthesis